MIADRRMMLRLLGSGLVLSTTASLAFPSVAASRARRQPTALLVPMTGASAGLGLSMQRAAMLAQSTGAREDALIALDTGGTPAGATAAARTALRRGAGAIVGPLFAAEVRPVLAEVGGRVPVISLSNDSSLVGSGAFLFGITPSQTTSAILAYARRRGVRRVAVLAGASQWAVQSLAAANAVQAELGISVAVLASVDPAALRQAGGGGLPDALLLCEGGATALSAARMATGLGIQLLATVQAADDRPVALSALDGAWIAAPDPAALAAFAERHGGAPGLIAALAHDAATIAVTLASGGRSDRARLLATGFDGITGALRFRADGSAARELAVLVVSPGGVSVVDRSVGV